MVPVWAGALARATKINWQEGLMDRMKQLGWVTALLLLGTALSAQGLESLGENPPTKPLIKAALATFPTTGLSLGIEIAPGYEKKMRQFINLEAMTCLGWLNSLGANVEFRSQPARGSGFYYSGCLGLEMVFYDHNWLVQDTSPSYVMFPMPQVAGGLGYQWEFGDRNWFFVEAKAGVMIFVGTLRVGMIF